MRLNTTVVYTVSALAIGGLAQASPITFATDGDSLYSVNLATPAATLIGSHLDGLMEAIAVDPGGNIFGTNSIGEFYSIDPATGLATIIATMATGNIEALDFFGSTLYAGEFLAEPRIFSIDTTNGALTTVASAPASVGVVRALTMQDANTALLFDSSGAFYSVDLNSNTWTVLATDLSVMWSLDFAPDGTLYGAFNGVFYTVNPLTGARTLLGDLGGNQGVGLAIVPEPAPGVTLAFGLLAISMFRNSRRPQRKVRETVSSDIAGSTS